MYVDVKVPVHVELACDVCEEGESAAARQVWVRVKRQRSPRKWLTVLKSWESGGGPTGCPPVHFGLNKGRVRVIARQTAMAGVCA